MIYLDVYFSFIEEKYRIKTLHSCWSGVSSFAAYVVRLRKSKMVGFIYTYSHFWFCASVCGLLSEENPSHAMCTFFGKGNWTKVMSQIFLYVISKNSAWLRHWLHSVARSCSFFVRFNYVFSYFYECSTFLQKRGCEVLMVFAVVVT